MAFGFSKNKTPLGFFHWMLFYVYSTVDCAKNVKIWLICINCVIFLARTSSVVNKVSVSIKIVLVRINAIISYLVVGGEYYRGGKKTNEYRTALL